MPGLSPSTRPTRSLGVAVVGNERSIQLTPRSLSYAEVAVLNVRSEAKLGRRAAPDDLPFLEDLVQVRDPRERRHEVVAHGQVREHLAPLRNQTEPGLGHAVGGQPMNRAALEADRAGLRRREAHDRADRRGLAHAVAAEQGYHLSRADREAHPEQDLAHAVRGLDRIDGEHQAWSSPR